MEILHFAEKVITFCSVAVQDATAGNGFYDAKVSTHLATREKLFKNSG